MSEFVLNAEIREHTGKHAKYARGAGMVPGRLLRARRREPQHPGARSSSSIRWSSRPRRTSSTCGSKDGTAKKCILRDVQYDPVSDRPIHFDLQGLKENEKLTIEVPIVLTGGIPQGRARRRHAAAHDPQAQDLLPPEGHSRRRSRSMSPSSASTTWCTCAT